MEPHVGELGGEENLVDLGGTALGIFEQSLGDVEDEFG